MTKAQIFVPHALAECAAIRQAIGDLQNRAVALKSRYDAIGGATMDGLAAFPWDTYGLVQLEFTDGMTDLSVTHNNVALSTVLSGGGYNKVVKLGEAI